MRSAFRGCRRSRECWIFHRSAGRRHEPAYMDKSCTVPVRIRSDPHLWTESLTDYPVTMHPCRRLLLRSVFLGFSGFPLRTDSYCRPYHKLRILRSLFQAVRCNDRSDYDYQNTLGQPCLFFQSFQQNKG